MADKPEADAMLAFFDAGIAAWVAAKESYIRAASFGQPGTPAIASLAGSGAASFAGEAIRKSIDLPIGALRGKSVPDAIRLFLSAGRRKQTNKEIAVGLRQGGLETTAGNFEANIAAALFRLKKSGVVLRFKDGWDLAEHYPDHIRNKLENEPKPKPTGSAKKKARKRTAVTSRRKSGVQPKAKAHDIGRAPSLDKRILEFFEAATAAQGFSPKDAAKAVGETNPKAVGMAFARLVRFGKVTKDENGLYRAA